MALPLIAAGLDVGFGIANMISGFRADRERKRLLRAEQVRIEKLQAEYDSTFGRLGKQLFAQDTGQGGFLAQEGALADTNAAELRLRSLQPTIAGGFAGQRDALDQSLAARGVSGGATAAGLSEISKAEGLARSTATQGSLEQAHQNRLALFRSGQRPGGAANLLNQNLSAIHNPIPIDVNAINTGVQAVGTAWQNLRRPGRRGRGAVDLRNLNTDATGGTLG